MNNSEKKPFKTGITVGRFQIIHKGHVQMIEAAVSVSERTAIFVGSSQESGTEKNPLSYEMRKEMLKSVFGDRVEVFPLPDIGVGNNPRWGDYVLKNAAQALGEAPDLVVSGKEDRRSAWYDCDRGEDVAELFVPKRIEISASRMREFLLSGDRDSWEKFSPEALWGKYSILRGAVAAAAGKTKTSSI